MTVKRLGHSDVRYGNRVIGIIDKHGSNIDAVTTRYFTPEGEPRGNFRLDFEIGGQRGNKIEVHLNPPDFRKLLDLMIEADHSTALREMSAAVAKALGTDK